MVERMDPVLRLMWWKENFPELIQNAEAFLGWHDFLCMQMCDRAVVDKSTASRWLVYNLERSAWDEECNAVLGVEAKFLPEILPWGAQIGSVKTEIANQWNIQEPPIVAVGIADLGGAALGAGVTTSGSGCLASGSFENLIIPTPNSISPSLLSSGFSMVPHPGMVDRAILALSPTGTAVISWARNLLGISLENLDELLTESDVTPSPVLSIPYLSGALLHWEKKRKLRGGCYGITLSTSPIDIVKSLMESIAYDHVLTIEKLRNESVHLDFIRAMGGGTRSEWWNQLKSDLMGIPIEVIAQPEPGTLGAAILAGLAIGVFDNLDDACVEATKPGAVFEPNNNRKEIHAEKIQEYRQGVLSLV